MRLTRRIPARIPSLLRKTDVKRNCRMMRAISTTASKIQTHVGAEVVSGRRITGKQSRMVTNRIKIRPSVVAILRPIFPKLFDFGFTTLLELTAFKVLIFISFYFTLLVDLAHDEADGQVC